MGVFEEGRIAATRATITFTKQELEAMTKEEIDSLAVYTLMKIPAYNEDGTREFSGQPVCHCCYGGRERQAQLAYIFLTMLVKHTRPRRKPSERLRLPPECEAKDHAKWSASLMRSAWDANERFRTSEFQLMVQLLHATNSLQASSSTLSWSFGIPMLRTRKRKTASTRLLTKKMGLWRTSAPAELPATRHRLQGLARVGMKTKATAVAPVFLHTPLQARLDSLQSNDALFLRNLTHQMKVTATTMSANLGGKA